MANANWDAFWARWADFSPEFCNVIAFRAAMRVFPFVSRAEGDDDSKRRITLYCLRALSAGGVVAARVPADTPTERNRSLADHAAEALMGVSQDMADLTAARVVNAVFYIGYVPYSTTKEAALVADEFHSITS
ncbi:MAG: hypothetical protein AAF689_12200 [Pseudomonadota bacterium]